MIARTRARLGRVIGLVYKARTRMILLVDLCKAFN